MITHQTVSPGRRPGRARPSPREGALLDVSCRTVVACVATFRAEPRGDAPTQGRARPFAHCPTVPQWRARPYSRKA